MDLVLGIDSSTTATKAIAWDDRGRAAAEGRAAVPMTSPRPGWFEQEPDDWWTALIEALRDLFGKIDPTRVAALAIANQRETVGFLDDDGRSTHPGIVWLDERSKADVRRLADRLGAERLLTLTGKVPNTTAALYAIAWVARTAPQTLAATRWIVDVHGYLAHRLTGERTTSFGSADPHAIMDLGAMTLSAEAIEAAGAQVQQFYTPVAPGAVIGEVTQAAAEATGLRPGTAVVAGGGDGQACGLGTAIIERGSAYVNLGTAAVSGVWSADYRTGRAFRTLASLSGAGYILELCLRTGSFLTDWTVTRLFGRDPQREPDIYDRLEAEAASLGPGADGLLLLPYWSGVMTPFWDDAARGAVVGFGPGHGRAHLYRALMEGIALDQAMGFAAVEAATGEPVRELAVTGGGAKSALWRQIIADATGKPLCIEASVEATCLGAGMLAAAGAGWFDGPPAAARAMRPRPTMMVEPEPRAHATYLELLELYRRLHPALEETFAGLARINQDNQEGMPS